KRIAAFGSGGILVWDAESGNALHTLTKEKDDRPQGNGLAFSPDGRTLAVVSEWGVLLWDVETGKERNLELEPHQHSPTCLAFTPDGEWVVAGTSWGRVESPAPPTLFAWDVKTGKQVAALKHRGGVDGVAVSPDGKMIASTGTDLSVRIWDRESKKEKW